MSIVTVRFKEKFSTAYNSAEYSYKHGMDLETGDIVCVNTCYGLEMAQVVNVNPPEAVRSKATKYVYMLIKPNDGAKNNNKSNFKTSEAGKASDDVW